MKGKLFFVVISATVILSGIALAEGSVTTSEWNFDLTAEQTYNNNRCSRGYSKLKKVLKNEAKNYCAREHGSHGTKMFKVKWWNKISCKKKKPRGEKTTVHVKGSYRAICN